MIKDFVNDKVSKSKLELFIILLPIILTAINLYIVRLIN